MKERKLHWSSGTSKLLRDRRRALDITAVEIIDRIREPISVQFISNIERGLTPIPEAKIGRWAKAYELDPVSLVDSILRDYRVHLLEVGGK